MDASQEPLVGFCDGGVGVEDNSVLGLYCLCKGLNLWVAQVLRPVIHSVCMLLLVYNG